LAALTSLSLILSLTFSLVLVRCSSQTFDNSPSGKANSGTSSTRVEQSNTSNVLPTQDHNLAKIYTQAIGDYIRLVAREYELTFDTLLFGKHVYGQPDDFPDIELPSKTENTNLKLITPEQGEIEMKKNSSSVYVNLNGWVESETAEFIFVTFSNGFEHQFDCFINYQYNSKTKTFVLKNSRFENYSKVQGLKQSSKGGKK
jgi:hypothetical protein